MPRASSSSRAARTPFLLNAGAVEHYRDPAQYDRLYEARTEDRDFYLRQARGARRILEYGAGTGRLTLPLLLAGKEVTAVDTSAAMLGALERRVQAAEVSGRWRAHCADMRTFSTRARFDRVIVGFHAFGHLYSHRDVTSFLGKAWRHLVPGGRLLLDLPLPHLDAPGYDGTAQVSVTEMDGAGGSELLTLRQFHPQELLMHLDYAGFERARLSGDFQGGPLDGESDVIVATAWKPQC